MPSNPSPQNANLAENLVATAAAYPDRVALKCDDLTYTYAEFDRAAARVATRLADAGIRPGDRVGIMLPNTPAFAIAFYGIMRAGAIAVPMNPLLKAREVEYYLANTSASSLLATSAFADAARAGADAAGAQCTLIDDAGLEALLDGIPAQAAPVPRAADDTAVVLHTSGTTGKPKGAELTHDGLGGNALIAARTLVETGPDDVIMGCLPLFHVFGMTAGLNTAVLSAATITLIPRFEAAKALEVIRRDGVTVFEGVPTMYSALLAAAAGRDDPAPTLRVCISGGAALPVQVLRDFDEAFGATVLEGYGLSETSPIAAFNHPDRPRRPGTIGTPIEGVEMRVVDESGQPVPRGERGEIEVRGPNVMKGYWNLPDATAAAINSEGWFATGDIGIVDEDGYFSIVDRKKEMIIRGGLNIYPREIEEVLYEHPAVAGAAVIGAPHDTLGEEVAAAIELKPGAAATADELRAYVKERVAAYKYPRIVWVTDALPKGPTGKILKREIVIEEGADK
ncbi:long-chain fatty acid--CoA ligase [Tsukamurella sp. 8F]|uniref:long-chain-fatty-acid--CoA ligase n=1 Tax=unclassified Tsukamurella TaxID=2633480 RepID=UPI0023B8CEC3|nr:MULTISPECIES: long-chain fatty acid--CoA ligase [unclassified Tsukamurella]MDF0532606.1 long-chain fatty acid--CoA ligase [Tsukamurella sp. 8J]MDF0589139.1 long-chain fatty acid--CoA ligase [Tsukamurella sp. 8F]